MVIYSSSYSCSSNSPITQSYYRKARQVKKIGRTLKHEHHLQTWGNSWGLNSPISKEAVSVSLQLAAGDWKKIIICGEFHLSSDIAGVELHFDFVGLLIKQSDPSDHLIYHIRWNSMINNLKETHLDEVSSTCATTSSFLLLLWVSFRSITGTWRWELEAISARFGRSWGAWIKILGILAKPPSTILLRRL